MQIGLSEVLAELKLDLALSSLNGILTESGLGGALSRPTRIKDKTEKMPQMFLQVLNLFDKRLLELIQSTIVRLELT